MIKKYFDLIAVFGLVTFFGNVFTVSESFAKSVTATKTEISLVAVSYTHLTLPTNSLV